MSLPKRKRVPTARALAFKEEKDELRRKHHGKKPESPKRTRASNRPRGRPRKRPKKRASQAEEVSDTERDQPATNNEDNQGGQSDVSDQNDQNDKQAESSESSDKPSDDAKPNGHMGKRPRGRPKGSGRRRRKPLPPKSKEKRPRGRPRKSVGEEPTTTEEGSPRKSKRKTTKVDDDEDEPGPLGDELDLLQDDEVQEVKQEKEETKSQKRKKKKKPAAEVTKGKEEEDNESDLPVVVLDANLPENFDKDFRKEFRVVMWSDLLGDPLQPYQSTKDAEKKTKLGKRMDDVVGIFTYNHPKVAGHLMDDLPNLRAVSNFGVGYDHIDGKAAAERKIPVGHTPGVLSDATADMAMSLLLAIARNVVSGHEHALNKKTTSFRPNWLGTQVTGATIGIVGLGRIGLEVAKRAALGFSMKVLYHTRTPKKYNENFKMQYCDDLKVLLQQADFVVLCVPQTPETAQLINSKRLRQMKKSAFLINVARGAVVDQDALTNALNDGTIAGAALDVTDPEPLPRKHPLLRAKNLIITPHFGSATHSTRRKMFDMSVQNLLSGIAGKVMPNSVPETTEIPGRTHE